LPHFKADLGQLSRIREFVTETAAALGVVPTALDDLRLAVDEAVTNIIVHGYRGAGEITLDITADGNDLVVELRDEAPAFDPTAATTGKPRQPEAHTSPGGFGLYLIRQSMDEISYRRTSAGNELTMRKRDVVKGVR